MALTLSPARIIRSGGPYLQVVFSVVLDGTETTNAAVPLPASFPNLRALVPTASGTGAGQPMSYSATGPISPVVYSPAFGGTATATVVNIVPGTAPATQLGITVSAAGTAGQTINVVAIVPDTF